MKPNGAIFYKGPSLLDGKPIVGIITGLHRPTKNPKTGPMLQTWILRSRISPLRALDINGDASIYGDCALRGDACIGRSCYVQVKNAPLQVYKAFKRGNYPAVQLPQIQGKALCIGSYGDPAAIPTFYWQTLASVASTWTGYTHAWRTCDPQLRELVMASVDSEYDRIVADAKGWRTFRIRTATDTLDTSEVVCPASEEAGHRTTCHACRLCQGNHHAAKSVAIIVHGFQSKNFITLNSLKRS